MFRFFRRKQRSQESQRPEDLAEQQPDVAAEASPEAEEQDATPEGGDESLPSVGQAPTQQATKLTEGAAPEETSARLSTRDAGAAETNSPPPAGRFSSGLAAAAAGVTINRPSMPPAEQADQTEAAQQQRSPLAEADAGPTLTADAPLTAEPPLVADPGEARSAQPASATPEAHPAPSLTPAERHTPKVGGTAVERPGERPRRFLLPQAPEDTAKAEPSRKSWLDRLKSGLSRTGQSFAGLFAGVTVDEDLFDELETALIMSDAGMEATTKLLDELRARVRRERIEDGNRVKEVLQELLAEHLKPLQSGFDIERAKPLVIMIAGVNGAGKTTSIGKLARTFQACGKSVLLAAGDTFRAAAREQLIEWGERNNVAVIAQREGGDPAAVAFDAVQAGKARGIDIVMIDTAGRLPTQLHLMAELQKVRRVLAKADPDAPHEVLLVVDGNTGQNALAQIKAFDDALTLTGLVVTKLDGTAKGGILAAVAAGTQGVRPVPVYWIGVGEGVDDLQPFVAAEFAQAMLGSD